MYGRKNSGFTLAELMIVVVIIGILSAVGMVSYSEYSSRAKVAEAYTILGSMAQQQKTYFKDPVPYSLAHPGGTIPNSTHPTFHTLMSQGGITDGYEFVQEATWDEVEYPVPIGSKTYFSYGAISGKFIGGVEIEVTGDGPRHATTGHDLDFIESCSGNPGCQHACVVGTGKISTYVNSSPPDNYDWVILTAKQDLKQPDDPQRCTNVMLIIESYSNTQNPEPVSRGIIQFESGPGI